MYTGNCIHIVVYCEICFKIIYADGNLKGHNFYI